MVYMTKKYVLIGVYYNDGSLFPGYPGINKYEGPYNSKFPSPAASKAYTQVLQFIKAHHSWPHYQDIDLDEKLDLIIVIQEHLNTGNFGGIFSYLVWREPAPQGLRKISNQYGRSRKYKWKNQVVPIKEGESIEVALEKQRRRQDTARVKAERTGNLRSYNRDSDLY